MDVAKIETPIRLQLIDPAGRHFKWYRISVEQEEGLFSDIRVVVQFGRIGQQGERLVRHFSDIEDAANYVRVKTSEKLKRGYIQVEDSTEYRVKGCKLCDLLERFQSDSCFIAEFPNSVFLLNWDQTYRGRSMLVFKQHLEDFFNLAPSDILSILPEIRACERSLVAAFEADRINYLFMGNQSGHFHLHLVPRYKEDPNWGSSPFLDTHRATRPQLTHQHYEAEAKLVKKYIAVES